MLYFNVAHFLFLYMKHMNDYINEKLKLGKHLLSAKYVYYPKTNLELRNIIKEKIKEFNDSNTIDKNNTVLNFNDIDVHDIDDFSYVFHDFNDIIKIDISQWDVSKAKYFQSMFSCSRNLITTGDLSGWNIHNVEVMNNMFCGCYALTDIGDISGWDFSNVNDMQFAFAHCKRLKFIGDVSWNFLENVEHSSRIFYDSDKLKNTFSDEFISKYC